LGPESDFTALGFRALSYAWGDPEQPKQSIIIDDNLFSVRQNLHDFLEVYRKYTLKHTRQQTLWIDAISINQCDIEERNHQVWMMSSIYSQAEEVVIWLGRDFETISRMTRSRMSMLAALYNMLQPLSLVLRHWHAAHLDSIAASLLNGFIKLCRQYFDRVVRQLLRSARPEALWRSSYFVRRWVYSEMLLARSKKVFVGETSMSWTELLLLYKQMHPMASLVMGYGHIRRLLYTEPQRSVPLEHLLCDFSHTKCQEYHDYVYAFLAACGNGSAFPY
jgi:hypothetical protein